MARGTGEEGAKHFVGLRGFVIENIYGLKLV